jgi:hypothetical protein
MGSSRKQEESKTILDGEDRSSKKRGEAGMNYGYCQLIDRSGELIDNLCS